MLERIRLLMDNMISNLTSHARIVGDYFLEKKLGIYRITPIIIVLLVIILVLVVILW